MERRKENESSDMVAKIIYMGEFSLDQDTVLEVKSNPEFLQNLKTDDGKKSTLFAIEGEESSEEEKDNNS